jgi:hypothetical protein
MRIFGLMMVRNEADILRVNVQHHLAAGVDRMLVVDNGSTDGTVGILKDLSREGRVEWREDAGAYRQSEITTALAREAFRQGADWVIPIDADEFWHAPGRTLREALAGANAGALEVDVVNFIQRRDQRELAAEALLLMTRRTPLPIGPREQVRELVETRQFAYVETMYSTKWISRPSETIEIAMGNHAVRGIQGPFQATEAIVCFHAPLRAFRALEAKVEQGGRVAALGLDPVQGWHVRRWGRLAADGSLPEEWSANSYLDGHLNVYGERHAVVFDPRLRDLVRPWIEGHAPSGEPESAPEGTALLETIQRQIAVHQREYERVTRSFVEKVEERDTAIRQIQAELHEKVGQRDGTIAALQAELQAKVGERDARITALVSEIQEKLGERERRIAELQAELLSKVADRDGTIVKLTAELHETAERDTRVIAGLQAELLSKVGERDRTIEGLMAELQGKVGERDRTIEGLMGELQSKVGERDARIVELHAELLEKVGDRDRTIRQLQEELHEKVGDRDRTIFNLQAELKAKG